MFYVLSSQLFGTLLTQPSFHLPTLFPMVETSRGLLDHTPGPSIPVRDSLTVLDLGHQCCRVRPTMELDQFEDFHVLFPEGPLSVSA